ncbi:MAG: fumarylacetoacetate hydrolase family protein [Thermoanaerobaculia bacterium]|nr:fumarylacetoacetate hydrolase family protein [Thermoanaerobaculia bacterium]
MSEARAAMRLFSFVPSPGAPIRVGALSPDGRVVDLGAEARRQSVSLSFDPADMLSLIAAGKRALVEVQPLVGNSAPGGPRVEDVRLAAPIPVPRRNVHCVGWNYVEHFEEGKSLRDSGQTLPEHPVFFTKGTNAVNGPYDPIPYDPRVSTAIDWEVELAVIVGRRGKNLSEEEAMDHVFGFCALNDTTARDIQQKKHGGQWWKGKSLDGHAPMGPWIVTADGFDWSSRRLVSRVNGVVKQDGNTSQMYFKVPRLLAELSLGLTLEPGDILATGTPPGIGHARKPPEYLRPGDVLESEIEGIGVLRNPIQAV